MGCIGQYSPHEIPLKEGREWGEVKCPICGEELVAGPGEQIVRFVAGATLDLRTLDWEERAFAHPPCGWIVVKPTSNLPSAERESQGG